MSAADPTDRTLPAGTAAPPSKDGATSGGAGGAGAARTPPTAARLGLMIGEDRLLVELTDAGEISLLGTQLVPVPLALDWLLGLTNLRGSIYTVCDLRRFLGGSPVELGREARLLSIASVHEFNACIVISRMLGLRNTASMIESDHAPMHGGMGPFLSPGQRADWLGKFYVDADGNCWRELSLARLSKCQNFLLVGR